MTNRKENSCSTYPIGNDGWAVTVNFGSLDEGSQVNKDPIAIHFVIDNSGSMGTMTAQVRDIFSEMVDSVATAPCSLTVFDGIGRILDSNIESTQDMQRVRLPAQGTTNIPAGIEKALGIIYGQDTKQIQSSAPRTHHVLILLSDGKHNQGPTPEKVFPTLGGRLYEDTKLSVVVVGFSQQSSTSMGMLLKQSIETIAFQADVVQTIYFATTKTALSSALASLESGLNNALKGSFHEVKTDIPCIIQDFSSEPLDKIRVHMLPDSTSISLLCIFETPPKKIYFDGDELPVVQEEGVQFNSMLSLIQGLIDRTKIRVVATKNSSSLITKSVKRLENLYAILQSHPADGANLDLKSLSAKERVKHFREIRKVTNAAGALKNQILDIANFANNDSESQASFLNGRSMKYANKALRRAAKREDNILDPKAEQRSMQKYLESEAFHNKLRSTMYMDVLRNINSLSDEEFKTLVESSNRNKDQLKEIRSKVRAYSASHDDPTIDIVHSLGLGAKSMDLINSGALADYLNDACHGKRQSFISMASPWQHLEEWLHFQDQPFESTWEMLMYGGVVGYPIFIERSDACQMNPFLLEVKAVRSTLVDSASICCANQAGVPVYGPEAGKPIEDVLVLIDPSMPSSSKLICGSVLLGEKYTSTTIARDLQMYSGMNMRVSLHSNTLFHLMSSSDTKTTSETQEEIIANLRRTFMGRAFMCPMCSFGPVDHFACGDLMSHHGEAHGHNSSISNACPQCNWFSAYIEDWDEWDGTVSEEFLRGATEKDSSSSPSSKKRKKHQFMSEAKIDLLLRILYSFRKMSAGSYIWDEYKELAKRIVDDPSGNLDLSTKAGVDGLSQVAITLLGVLNDASVMENGKQVWDSTDLLLSIIKEECARDCRKKFRHKAAGNKMFARQNALDFLTKLLGIDEDTAPQTQDLMEPEPQIENVRSDCLDFYQLDVQTVNDILPWIRDICRQWCRVWSLAKGFSSILDSRKGGWEQLERDMETSIPSYQDVVDHLKQVPLETPRDLLLSHSGGDEGEELSELQNFFVRLAVHALVYGAGDSSLPPAITDNDAEAASSADGDYDILSRAAREMRMRIYLARVSTKMASWKTDGQQMTFFQARTADIQQFCDMIRTHTHGLDKQTFWGLWLAAIKSKDEAKIEAFLSLSNDQFRHKHAGTRR